MQQSQAKVPASKSSVLRITAAAILIASALSVAACGTVTEKKEYLYAAEDKSLRDRVSTVFNKSGLVHGGERLQVLERMQNKHFVKVRTPRGEEGWLQERFLVDQQTFDQFQRMSEQYANTAAQGTATTEELVRMHVLPGRKTSYLYMLAEKQKVDLLQRQAVPRNAKAAPVKEDKQKDKDDSDDDDQDKPNQPVIMEDWWLVRDQQKRAGWVYGRTLYLSVPDEVAQYAEGQRIVAAFPLDEVEDGDKKVGEYLVLLTENKDGMPFDFNQARVYTWNKKKHRYETAYRERNLFGLLPVTLGQQDFGKEGMLRTFTLHLQQDDGQKRQQLYKFNPPIVRKVFAPGEEPPKPNRKKSEATPKARKRQG